MDAKELFDADVIDAAVAAGDEAKIITYSVYAPKSGGGIYRHPCDICIVVGFRPAARRGPDARRVYTVACNVDGRYSGPRSAFGRGMAEAVRLQAAVESLLEARATPASPAHTQPVIEVCAEVGV